MSVKRGAEIFEKAEESARHIKAEFRELRKVFASIRDEGHIGGLECEALSGEADALATKFEADLYAMHSRLTKRAQELGIDLPAPRSGGR